MDRDDRTAELDRPFGVTWGQVYGIEHRLVSQPAEVFLPQARQLGATAVRITFYWGQIEPEPGRYEWAAVDAFLAQLTADDEAWVAVAASSTWATRVPSTLIPSSPPKLPEQYARMVRALVERAAGRVRYWQPEFEVGSPFWAGSAADYVRLLGTFARAVRDTDPTAQVVLGGFLDDRYDASIARASAVAEPAPSPAQLPMRAVGAVLRWHRRRLYHELLRHADLHVDVVDVHLYQDPYTIPASIDHFRHRMAVHGYDRPIFVGEYNGPSLVAFPPNLRHLRPVMTAMHSLGKSLRARDDAAAGRHAEAEQRAMAGLYARRTALPPQLQMFMEECPAQLRAHHDRISSREVVVRAVLALAAGARKVFCFNLAPELAGRPYQVLNLMFNGFRLMDYDGGQLSHYRPAAHAWCRMTSALHGVRRVRRVEVPGRPAIHLFEVDREARAPCLVVWEQRDSYTAEDQPPTDLELSWPSLAGYSGELRVLDALGATATAPVHYGMVRLAVSATPLFLQAAALPPAAA